MADALPPVVARLIADTAEHNRRIREAAGVHAQAYGQMAASSSGMAKSHERDSARTVAAADKVIGAAGRMGSAFGKLSGPTKAGMGWMDIPFLITLSQSMITMAGSAALLPGVLFAGAAGMAAIKLGTQGFGDAMKSMDDPAKFAESIAKLAPAAQETAKEVRALRPEWKAMQLDVQQQLFEGLGTTVKQLGGTYIPVLRTELRQTAAAMGASAQMAGKALMQPAAIADVNNVLGYTNDMFRVLGPAVGDVLSGLLGMAGVGAEFLPGLGAGAAEAAANFKVWVDEMVESGRMHTMISNGLSNIGDLFKIVANVIGIFRAALRATQADGAGLLETIENLTARGLEWANSMEGQEKIKEIFDLLSQVAWALMQVLPHVASTLSFLAGVMASLPGPVQTVVGALIGWGALFGPIIAKLMGLIATMRLQSAVAKMTATANNQAAARTSGGWIASAFATIGAFLKMAAAAAVNAARTGAAWLLTTGVAAASAVASTAAAAARIVAQWVAMAAGAMARAVVMAAAWLVAMGPIGWIIAAIIALVALIIMNWETVKQWTIAAWQAVVGAVTAAWDWIVAKVQWGINAAKMIINWFAELPGLIAGWFGAAKDWAVAKLQELLGWLGGLPGRILSAIGDLGSLLVDAGRSLITGLWNGIKAMGSWLWGKIMGWIRSVVPGPILSFLGISSPSKWAEQEVGRMIPRGLARGIIGESGVVVSASKRLAQMAAPRLSGALAGAASRYGSAGGGNVTNIYNIAGSVLAERELNDLIQRGSLRRSLRNPSNGLSAA